MSRIIGANDDGGRIRVRNIPPGNVKETRSVSNEVNGPEMFLVRAVASKPVGGAYIGQMRSASG
jgi:hypothetical protein